MSNYDRISAPMVRYIFEKLGVRVEPMTEENKASWSLPESDMNSLNYSSEDKKDSSIAGAFQHIEDIIYVSDHGWNEPDTLFHELGHWTGNRCKIKGEPRSSYVNCAAAYWREELVATIFAGALCKKFGYDTHTCSSYFHGIIRKMMEENMSAEELGKSIFGATGAAQEAVLYVLKHTGLLNEAQA